MSGCCWMARGSAPRRTMREETDPTNSNNVVNSGNQLVKGVQFSMVGRLPRGHGPGAGICVSRQRGDSRRSCFRRRLGIQLANVPKQTFNAFITHRLPLRLSGGLGGNYVASRTASSTVPLCGDGLCGESEWAGICGDQRWRCGRCRDTGSSTRCCGGR